MDFGFFEFLQDLKRQVVRQARALEHLTRTMTQLVARVAAVVDFYQTVEAALKAELAATKEALAAALADDAADEEAIAAAQADAAAAKEAAEAAAAKVGELQALVDADTEEDAAIGAILDTVPMPEPPMPEPELVEELTPEV